MKTVAIVSLITAALLFLVAGIIYLNPSTDIVRGKISFASESDYTQFKLALAQSYVRFNPRDVTVLASDPPIIVSFDNVLVKHDQPFPFGSRYPNSDGCLIPTMFGAVALIVGIIGRGFAWAEEQR